MPYNEHLAELSALSLENLRHYKDMTTIYKFLHCHVDSQASDVGLHVAASSTRDADMHFAQRRTRNCYFRKFVFITCCYGLK